MKDYTTILVPVDFNEPSLKATQYAAQLAGSQNGEVILMNVIETPGLLMEFFSSGDELVKITNKAKDKLLELTGSLQKSWPNVKFRTLVERGKPYIKILEAAQQSEIKMVVLGENHDCQEPNTELGTTVFHVTLKSTVPVLTIKGMPVKSKNKIVLPLDLTRETAKNLKAALMYGKNYNSEIHLVSALIGGIRISESRIYKKLKEAEKVLNANDIRTQVKVFDISKVPPFMRVLEYAEEVEADMIIVMTHQEGFSYDNYIGAFAHHIINLSKVSVLSLTASATNNDIDHYFKTFIDPIGFFRR
ncbi:MAG: universal stress protein [Bacteroidetes bacterium]|nr:universal stress protein [Bacteroidota bacterium]